jgi:hypothetical protein
VAAATSSHAASNMKKRILQHSKTAFTTFENNICNIENQMLQWGESTSATLKHLDLLLQHPQETLATSA